MDKPFEKPRERPDGALLVELMLREPCLSWTELMVEVEARRRAERERPGERAGTREEVSGVS